MAASGFDAAIAERAAARFGVITSADVVALGGTEQTVRTRVESGRWERLARGVYRIAGLPPSFEADCMAATLLTEGSAVSDLAGAGLQRLTGFGPCRPEVTTTVGRCHESPLAEVHRRSRYRTTRVQGIRVGTVGQIIGDLAGRVPLEKLERALDDALLERRLHLGHIEDLAVERSLIRGRGAVHLRRLVEDRSDGEPVAESQLEVPLRRLLRAPGIPVSSFQQPVPWWGSEPGRADACIERWRLIVEADGRRWHTRVQDFDVDRRRDRFALAVGYATIRFTYVDLTEYFEESLAQLRAIGAQRELDLFGHP